jgi:hypothetical protein
MDRQPGGDSRRADGGDSGRLDLGSLFNAGGGGGRISGEQDPNPLTGDNYTRWADRLRNVEEMVELPDLRTEIGRARDRARAVRSEFKRHSKEPQWDLVRTEIAGPLVEVRKRIAEELMRRESAEALVPIDRDPVPGKYAETASSAGNWRQQPI